jgi:hypothetical protein
MLAPFIALAARIGLTGTAQRIVGIGGGIIAYAALLWAVFALGQCDGKRTEAVRQEALRAKAVVEAIGKNAAAQEKAAEERATDKEVIDQKQEDLLDAIKTVPDTQPDAVRVALGCQRLRAQGSRDADLPAVCRTQGGTQAGGTP